MAEDPVISVRTCAISALLPLLNFSRDFAVELFLKACGRCPEICATDVFDRFVHYAIHTHYAEIRGLLQFALSSDNAKAVENAARQICVAELSGVDVGDDVGSVRSGSGMMRKAAAEVYATNIGHDEIGWRCAEVLSEFFNDQSEDVRLEVSQVFFKLSGLKLLRFQGFIEEYIESQAFETEPDFLLRAFEQSNVELPHVICRAAERILECVGEEGTHIAYRGAITAHCISTLVVRQYEQASDPELKTRCLDLIDRMERVGYYGIAEELGKLDR